MAKVKYRVTKRQNASSSTPLYVACPQHERTMSKKETYAFLADAIGYKSARIRGAFMALATETKNNAKDGLITLLEGVVSVRNTCRGGFASLAGPFVKGENYLTVVGVALNPFKSAIADCEAVNTTEGANPIIDTVLDEVTQAWNEITGTDPFSIAGSDLAPDIEKEDEYVALMAKDGTETKCEVTYSDLQNVQAKLSSALTPGEYTLLVYTRSGMGDEFGVRKASRKVTVK